MATAHRPDDQQQPTLGQGATGAGTGTDWDDLKGEVGGMAEDAMERGRQFLDSAKEQATSYVDQRKDEAAQTIVELAKSLRDTGGAFGERPNVRALVDGAANGLEQFAGSIRSRNFADIFGDVEAAVRRRPALAAAATMAAGFLLARFVKASADQMRQAGERGRSGGQPRHDPQAARANPSGPGQGHV